MKTLFKIHYDKALHYFQNRKFSLAKKSLKEALKADKNDLNALRLLASTERFLGNHQNNLTIIQKAYLIQPHNVEIINDYALSLIYLRDFQKAESVFVENLHLDKTSTLLKSNYGKLLMNLNNFDMALEVFTSASNFDTNVDILTCIARCYELKKNNEQATLYYNKILSLQFDHPDAQRFFSSLPKS